MGEGGGEGGEGKEERERRRGKGGEGRIRKVQHLNQKCDILLGLAINLVIQSNLLKILIMGIKTQ